MREKTPITKRTRLEFTQRVAAKGVTGKCPPKNEPDSNPIVGVSTVPAVPPVSQSAIGNRQLAMDVSAPSRPRAMAKVREERPLIGSPHIRE
jgi:hypothetical protein